MSWLGLFKPPYGMVIPPEWYHTVVDALDWLYMGYLSHQETLDCIERKLDLLIWYAYQEEHKLDSIHNVLLQIEGKEDLLLYYAYEETESLKRIETKLDKLDLLLLYAYSQDTTLKSIESKVDEIKTKTDLLVHYARFTSAGKGIKTITVLVTPTAKPLFVDELEIRRLIIKVPVDALYMVYVGDATSQEFPLSKGEQLELYVKSPKEVYVRSTGEQKIFALFELAQ